MNKFHTLKIIIIIVFSLTIFFITDSKGKYYGVDPFIFNKTIYPPNIKIEVYQYYGLYFTGDDELEIVGPGFQMHDSASTIEYIERYAISDSSLYIQCKTNHGEEIYYLDRGELFKPTKQVDEVCWYDNLLKNHELYLFLKILSILVFFCTIFVQFKNIIKQYKKKRWV